MEKEDKSRDVEEDKSHDVEICNVTTVILMFESHRQMEKEDKIVTWRSNVTPLSTCIEAHPSLPIRGTIVKIIQPNLYVEVLSI